MNNYKLAVIGVGNMAKAVISGIQKSDVAVSEIFLYDKNESRYDTLTVGKCPYIFSESLEYAVKNADCILLSVKPQNFPDILSAISDIEGSNSKLYITIAAGITVDTVSSALNGANVVRVLPNLPMTVGEGVSVICNNDALPCSDFAFVCSLFSASGSTVLINENEMNRMIGVTSSSPAYVFKFINAIIKAAEAQGLNNNELLYAVCDVFIGSALLLKNSGCSPEELIARVASKGGTTEQALLKLDEGNVDTAILNAMIACTNRADELGTSK